MRERISSTHSVMCSIVQPTQNKLYELTAQRYKIMQDNNPNIPLRSGETLKNSTGNFFNTVGLTGEELKQSLKQNGSQEQKILKLLQKFPFRKFTKFKIKSILVDNGQISERTPESSINRALSQLKDKGLVDKLGEMQEGGLGKPNHLWRLHAGIDTTTGQIDIF